MNKKKISIISTIVIIGVGALGYTAYAQYQKKSKINTFKTDLESFQQETKNSIMSKDENSEVNSLISECNKIVDTSNINAIPEIENKLNSELNEIKKENETLIENQIKEVSSLNTSKLSDKDDITKKLNDIKSLESKGEFASANQELIKLKEHINSENESIEKKEQEEAKKKVEEEKKKQEAQLNNLQGSYFSIVKNNKGADIGRVAITVSKTSDNDIKVVVLNGYRKLTGKYNETMSINDMSPDDVCAYSESRAEGPYYANLKFNGEEWLGNLCFTDSPNKENTELLEKISLKFSNNAVTIKSKLLPQSKSSIILKKVSDKFNDVSDIFGAM
ncbi:MAG: hypothetical protein E6038_04755 [Clostridium perfringens]|uniref:hypothetical protein n=1 Tax=Clostridium perfringens TaxID=1502 RepID=UPI002911BA92|nr:hypothetical protein [Clostridium perfringens]MDU5650419.1 hypothetical protein [Clostridium perfringens]